MYRLFIAYLKSVNMFTIKDLEAIDLSTNEVVTIDTKETVRRQRVEITKDVKVMITEVANLSIKFNHFQTHLKFNMRIHPQSNNPIHKSIIRKWVLKAIEEIKLQEYRLEQLKLVKSL